MANKPSLAWTELNTKEKFDKALSKHRTLYSLAIKYGCSTTTIANIKKTLYDKAEAPQITIQPGNHGACKRFYMDKALYALTGEVKRISEVEKIGSPRWSDVRQMYSFNENLE